MMITKKKGEKKKKSKEITEMQDKRKNVCL